MNANGPEIDKLREFRAELAEPGEQRLARIRLRMEGATGQAPVATRWWSRRTVVVPAVAAASVLAVAVGAATIGLPRSDQPAGAPPAAKSTALPSPVPATPTAAPPTEKTASTPDAPTPAEHQAAVDLLERFASSAGNWPAPLTVPAGQLLYVRGGTADGRTYMHELWLDVNGCIPVMIRRTDNGQVTVLSPDPTNPKDNLEQEAAEQRARLAADGPSLLMPTPEHLAGLPTDPDAMLALLRQSASGGSAWSADRSIIKDLHSTLYNAEPLLTPQVRASLYRALARLGSLGSTGQQHEVEGRKVYSIWQRERGQSQELLLDAETGRIVGSRYVTGQGEPDFVELWSHAVVAEAGQVP